MTKRKLKRQLSLIQVVMLGTAGAIGAEIFVLTGHAAAISGPAMIFAILIGGLLSYSIAMNLACQRVKRNAKSMAFCASRNMPNPM